MNGYLNESNFLMVEEGFTTRDLLENLLGELCQESEQQAFFMADLGDIVKKHLRFLKALPRVKPYFPVKCNGSEGVIRLLAELGAGFACANKAEISRVQGIGVPADRIFYSSPCKQVAHIRYAATHGVRLMAFDNEVELSKVARSHPRARLLLGITADSIPSAHPSMTFGTTLKSCRHLLETAKEQAVEVVGIRYSHGPSSIGRKLGSVELFSPLDWGSGELFPAGTMQWPSCSAWEGGEGRDLTLLGPIWGRFDLRKAQWGCAGLGMVCGKLPPVKDNPSAVSPLLWDDQTLLRQALCSQLPPWEPWAGAPGLGPGCGCSTAGV
ncbi:hypothetical protein Nmel_017589 [Mimus melanotis]